VDYFCEFINFALFYHLSPSTKDSTKIHSRVFFKTVFIIIIEHILHDYNGKNILYIHNMYVHDNDKNKQHYAIKHPIFICLFGFSTREDCRICRVDKKFAYLQVTTRWVLRFTVESWQPHPRIRMRIQTLKYILALTFYSTQ
jgi:hypothetical protein